MNVIENYEWMYTIRCFEESVLRLFSENKLTGTTHTYIGQEAIAVSAMNNLMENDYVFSNHRCHGHFIAYSHKPELLLNEIMGNKYGLCSGRGGSQHINYRNFFTNGVQGGIVPNAVGLGFSEKIKGSKNISIVFLGDGTLGQGVVYESMNIASLYSVPVLFVVEDNSYAMTTKVSDGVAGNIIKRANAFNIEADDVTSNDVEVLDGYFKKATDYVRNNQKPYFLVVHTYRLGPHSKGDDFRNPDEIENHKKEDPLLLLQSKLDSEVVKKIQEQVQQKIKKIIEDCESKIDEKEKFSCNEEINNPDTEISLLNTKNKVKCCNDLNNGLDLILKDEHSVIMGEDIKDPYGGAFKVTKGLSTKYPNKVLNMPISEAAFTGIAIGMAMGGLKPIIEYMFGDFITLGFDQILNHGTKYNWMYNNKITVPVLFRAPMGGGRGYGPTHSQSLEKYFIGIPNLKVLAMNSFISGENFLQRIYSTLSQPTLLIENKKMYGRNLNVTDNNCYKSFIISEEKKFFPIIDISYIGENLNDIVFITYGATTDLCLSVVEKLMMKDEISAKVLSLTQISPIDYKNLYNYVKDAKYIITVEEGTKRCCWGGDVVSNLIDFNINAKFKTIASCDSVIPTNISEETEMLVNEDFIYKCVKELI